MQVDLVWLLVAGAIGLLVGVTVRKTAWLLTTSLLLLILFVMNAATSLLPPNLSILKIQDFIMVNRDVIGNAVNTLLYKLLDELLDKLLSCSMDLLVGRLIKRLHDRLQRVTIEIEIPDHH